MGGIAHTNETPEPDSGPKFSHYRRTQIIEARPYVTGELLPETLRVDAPAEGDYIARDPKNPVDQWLISAAAFAADYELIIGNSEPAAPAESTK